MPQIFGIKDKKNGHLCSEYVATDYSMDIVGKPGCVQSHSWYNISKTLLLVSSFLVWGLAVSVQWITLPDMRIRMGTTVHGPIYAMAIGAMGQMCGGVFAAFSDRYAKASDLMISGMLFVAASAYVVIPFCTSLDMLGICYMVTNLGFYFMQASAHSQVTSLWGTDGKPIRYALHFGFSVGLALGPILSRPFISGERKYDPVPFPGGHIANISIPETDEDDEYMTTTEKYFEIVRSPSRDESTIEYAYIIVFSFTILLAAVYVIFFFCGLLSATLDRLQKGDLRPSWKAVLLPRKWAGGDAVLGVVVFFMFITFCFIQQLLALGTQRYLMDFAMDSNLGFDLSTVSTLSLIVVCAGVLSRGLGMICTRFVSIRYLLLVVTAGQTLAAILCLTIGTRHAIGLWVLAPLLAFFREATLPTIYAWTDHYILVYGVLIGFSDLISTLATIIYLPFQEYLYKRVAIESIFHTAIAFGVTLFVFAVFMNWYTTRKRSRRARAHESYELNKEAAVPVFPDTIKVDGEMKEMTYTQI